MVIYGYDPEGIFVEASPDLAISEQPAASEDQWGPAEPTVDAAARRCYS